MRVCVNVRTCMMSACSDVERNLQGFTRHGNNRSNEFEFFNLQVLCVSIK